MTTTFGTSHGPTQPLMVSWTRFNSPRFRHSVLSHSTGTSGRPFSMFPQQQPRQIAICPITRRFVFRGYSRFAFTAFGQFVQAHDPISELRGNNLVELRMKASSDVT